MRIRPLLFLFLIVCLVPGAAVLSAQEQPSSAQAQRGERAVMARQAVLYLSPDARSQKLQEVERGREVVILAQSNGWLQVFANVEAGRDVTGWIRDKGVVRANTPNGDKILFGEAVDSESEASRRRGRKGAAQDAGRLYYRLSEYFPNSPLAGEALFRAADIRWQLDRAEAMDRPSAREADPNLRTKVDEQLMKMVKKKHPGTKWAEFADFMLLDNKLCGDWQGEPRCPERETGIYEDYVKDHPTSPKAPEAIYEAARRQAALVDIYKSRDDRQKSDKAKGRATELAQRIITQFPQSDWAPRAHRLLYWLQEGIAFYGPSVD